METNRFLGLPEYPTSLACVVSPKSGRNLVSEQRLLAPVALVGQRKGTGIVTMNKPTGDASV